MRCAVVFLALGLLAVCARAELKRAGDGPEVGADGKIPVVKSWDELRALPALNAGGGIKVRLGIETVKAPRSSGVLIYCLADGYNLRWQAPDPDSQLGPVQFHFQRREVGKQLEREKVESVQAESEWPSGRLLFGQIIPVESEGEIEVTVSDQKGRMLAACTIEGTADAAHAWSPLKCPDDFEKLQEADSVPEVSLAYDGAGVAMAKLDGHAPILWESSDGARGPHSFGGKDPLPALEVDLVKAPALSVELKTRIEALAALLGNDDFQTRENATRELSAIGKPALQLLPALAKASDDTEVRTRIRTILESAGAGFSLRRVGKGFLVSMKTAFQITRPQDNFLTRWWVNGKPFSPREDDKGSLEDISGHVITGTSMLLRLHLDAAKLGAKKGDAIGLQLLYCPRGWTHVGQQIAKAESILEDGSDKFPMLSNKVEFVVP